MTIFENGPLVTVYLPVRNYGMFLTTAVESVLAQIYPNWELFIVDEGSDDDSARIAESMRLRDPARIRFIRHAVPAGLQRTANEILGLAQGRYFVRLDADDWLDESALLVMVAKLEADPSVGLVYGNYFYADERGAILGVERRRKVDLEDRSRALPPHGACTMVRTRELKAVGGYSEDVDAQDGWELWFKLLSRVKAANVDAPLFYYRQHERSLSRDGSRLLHARATIFSKLRSRLEGSYRPTCLAVVPVRESYPGFSEVPFRTIDGRSLLQIALESTCTADVSEVCVSSASPRVLEVSKSMEADGLVRPHLRVARRDEQATSRLALRQVLLQAAERYEEVHGAKPDAVLFLSLHAPLRNVRHVQKAIDTLRVTACDSVVSVVEEAEPMFTHGIEGLELLNPGRFDDLTYERERLYRFNGAVIGVWYEVLVGGDLFGRRVGFVEMSTEDSVQVKRASDLERIRSVLGARGEPSVVSAPASTGAEERHA